MCNNIKAYIWRLYLITAITCSLDTCRSFYICQDERKDIYIDTSVVGGYYDEEFKEATMMLFQRLEKNEVIFVVSDLLEIELIKAPQKVRAHFA